MNKFLTVKSLLHFGTGFNQMKVICFSQGTVATFTGEVDTFIII